MGWDGRFVAKSDIKKEVCNLWNGQKTYGSDDYFTVEKHEVFGSNHALAVARRSVDAKVKEVFAVVVLTNYLDILPTAKAGGFQVPQRALTHYGRAGGWRHH